MKNKSLAFTSVFFFAGAILILMTSLLSGEFSGVFFLVLDFIPETALAFFLFSLAKNTDRDSLTKAKKGLFVIFVLCTINAVILLIIHTLVMVLIENPDEHPALISWFVWLNYLNIFPFALLLSDIPAVLQWGISPMNVFSFLGNALVLTGFIRALLILNRSVRIPDSEYSPLPAEKSESAKMMSFSEAVKTCFKKYFSFHGCATRAEYWWFQLFSLVISSVLLIPAISSLINQDYRMYLIFMIILLVFTSVIIIPGISVGVRRIHDTGNRGFFICIPIANIINLLLPSLETSEFKSGVNKYPVANVLGKIFVVFSLMSYILYMGAALATVFLLS